MTQTIAMIETRAALEALDDISASGDRRRVHRAFRPVDRAERRRKIEPRGAPLMKEAGRIAARAKAHRKYAAMFCFDGADARAMAGLGFGSVRSRATRRCCAGAARAELAGRAGRSLAQVLAKD